jgi:carboxyl-terminal processing protease
MMDRATGYIKLNKFSETTFREFMQSLGSACRKARHAKIDPRPEGQTEADLSTQAVNIADEFLDGEQNDRLYAGHQYPKAGIPCKKTDGFLKKASWWFWLMS